MFAGSYLSQEYILPTKAILKENSQGTFKKARVAP